MSEALLITRDDFIKLSPLKGGVDSDKYTPFVKMAQDLYIQPILGTKLLDKIKDDILNNTLASPYIELIEYVKPCLVHYTMIDFLPWLVFTASNGGVFKYTIENGTPVEADELQTLIAIERDAGEHYGRRLIAYLTQNSTNFPEYLATQDGQMSPTSDEIFCGWVL